MDKSGGSNCTRKPTSVKMAPMPPNFPSPSPFALQKIKREIPPVTAPAGPMKDAAVRAPPKLIATIKPKVISTINADTIPNKNAESSPIKHPFHENKGGFSVEGAGTPSKKDQNKEG